MNNYLLNSKNKTDCEFDVVSLGEVMLRFDPGESRVRSARSFQVWEGGGEYNVARGCASCFDLNTSVITGIVNNELGHLLHSLICQGGVDVSNIKWFEFDGIGRSVRNALNFTERGFGIRGAVGVSDRGYSASAQLTAADFDLETLFGTRGVRLLHTGGIFTSLSTESLDLALQAIKTAKKHGTIISYDLNYRPSLWAGRGGVDGFRQTTQAILPMVDVLIGFPTLIGLNASLPPKGVLSIDETEQQILRVQKAFPNLELIASTVREVTSASENRWSATCYHNGEFTRPQTIERLKILDRVGGGDGFVSGLIYGLIEKQSVQAAVEYGLIHGALTMSTPGDNSWVSIADIEALMADGAGKTYR